MWQYALACDSYRRDSEDRAVVFPTPFGALAVVADGVGGRSGGAAAADAVVDAARELAAGHGSFLQMGGRAAWLRAIDHRLANSGAVGETTAVIAALTQLGPLGAAVGDSVAWWVSADGYGDLTRAAAPKPWIGSGMATPVEFGKPINHMTWLLLATDGLVKYNSPEVICDAVRSMPLDEAPRRLIELVRYPSGRLPDDVAVIVARWVRNETGG